MTNPGPRSHRSSTQRQGPTVRIVLDRPSIAVGGSFTGSPSGHSPKANNWYAWIVMSLLIASTALALYDLFLLMSVLTGGA